MAEIVDALEQCHSFDQAVDEALSVVKRCFNWAYGSYWKLNPVEKVLKFSRETGSVTPEFSQVTRSASFAEGVGLSGRAWQAKDLVFVADLGELTDCVRREPAQRAGVKSGVCFPLFQANKVIGTMDFFATETLTLSDSRMAVLRQVGRIVSARLSALDELEDMMAVSRVLGELVKSSSAQHAVDRALNLVKEAFGWAYGSFWAVDKASNTLVFKQETGTVTEEFSRVTREAQFAERVGLSGRAWKARDLYFTSDLGTMTDCCRREPAQRAGVKSGVCFPLIVGGQVVGTMDFFTLEVIDLSDSRIKALKNVGHVVSFVLEKFETLNRMEAERQTAISIKSNASSLANLADNLVDLSQVITATAHNSSQKSDMVASSAEEVSANSATVAASTEEMSSTIAEVSKQAQRASQMAVSAESKSHEVSQLLETLDESSREIGKVVDIIRDIASQTNLLALNATIEAASAGEAGKGFAVVANEVKELAKQSANSTETIRVQVESIQGGTNNVIQAISEIANAIESLHEINTTIAGAIEEQASVTNEISKNVSQSSLGAQDIARSVIDLSGYSQTTLSQAQQMADAVDLLRQTSCELTSLVAHVD